ncbi:MAG: hypothetical protein MIO90_02090 [Methanomassiliicoccales archaeon]|nr:hypothetical protein [Methanomassiliicoccales archaeon]
MKIKRKFLALIVATILIASSVVSLFAYQSAQDNRIAYIGVEADKRVFNSSEMVTFRLISLSEGVEFDVIDHWTAWGEFDRCGIYIVKIPETVDPDSLFEDLGALYRLNLQAHYHAGHVHFDHFDDKDEPLQLPWNGTLSETIWGENRTTMFTTATSGYYVILPSTGDYREGDENYVFVIDEGAVFYYRSLDAHVTATVVPDTNVTYEVSLRAPAGTVGGITCDLHIEMDYPGDPWDGSSNVHLSFDETDILLTATNETKLTYTFNASVPDHGYVRYDDDVPMYLFSGVSFDAMLVTPTGNYSFGLDGVWDGGWTDVIQY